MNAPDRTRDNVKTSPAHHRMPQRPQSVQKCNFRTAGHLSNEDARLLTAAQELFARNLGAALETSLGTEVTVKLEIFEQLSTKDHLANVSDMSYVVPFSNNSMIVEFDNALILEIVELLMGGTGEAASAVRELSEIEEAIMQDLIQVIAHHAESAWRIPGIALVSGSPVKVSTIERCFGVNEKVAVLKFAMQVANAVGSFTLVLSNECLKILMSQIRSNQPQKQKRVWEFKTVPLRERILDCEMEVTAELPRLRVSVRDLITLQPGSVLKLRAPIRVPAVLTSSGRELFEAVPVRNSSQRAAQLGRRAQSPEGKRR